MSLLELHLQRLQQKYPSANIQPLPNGSYLVTVPGVPLKAGWSRTATTVYFLAPVGYPMAQPDCFWADGDLRLQHGGMPKNSGQQALPNGNQPVVWFSWHPNGWNPNKDDLRAYMKVIEDRLAKSE